MKIPLTISSTTTLATSGEVRRVTRFLVALAMIAGLALTCASPAAAQKDKKKKQPAITPADSTNPLVPMSDENQIDYMVSEMLGAWQLGDIDKLHKDYADDVTVVNGAYAPPIVGWTNYLAVYQQQRARMQQVRMDRSNSLIRVAGNVGWICYQWDFAATADGQPTAAQGQTTLVVEKRNNHWIIVHNHTSMVRQLTPGANGTGGTGAAGTPPSSQPDASRPRGR
jgi:ketosteroid isomerase-like protein